MQFSLNSSNSLQKILTIILPSAEVESAYQLRLSNSAKTLHLKGFRPGKVPKKEVEKRFGKSIKKELINELMQRKFIEVIHEKSLQLVAQPQFEIVRQSANQDFEFKAKFDVYPEFKLASFDGIQIEQPQIEITEHDVESILLTLRQQQLFYAPLKRKRAAKEKDQVNIDFIGTIDKKEFEGGSFKDGDLVLGSGEMVPGFEDAIIGMKPGTNKETTLTFPSDYHIAHLAGKVAKFQITLNEVREGKLPELDESFIQTFGLPEAANLEIFKLEVKKNMQRDLKVSTAVHIKNQVMTALVKLNRFEVPSVLLANEIERQRLIRAKQLGNEQADPNILTDDLFEEKARNAITIGLIVNKITHQEKLIVDSEQVKQRIEEIAAAYEDAVEIKNWYLNNPLELRKIEQVVLEDQVVEFVLKKAQNKLKQYTYSEFMLKN